MKINLFTLKRVIMKQFLTLLLALCGLTATAQTAFQTHEAVFTSVSEDGNWAVGSTQGVAYMLNAKTGNLKVFKSDDETYDLFNVSNNGIACGSLMNPYTGKTTANIVTEEGGYVALPLKDGIKLSFCNGSPDDGSFIVGNVAIKVGSGQDKSNLYCPVVWYRNAEGKYDLYEGLPFDSIGFDNRYIQQAYALGVSGDGLTIYGRILYYAGDVYQPVVWTRSSTTSRDWVFKKLCQKYMFNTDKVVPKYPSYKPIEPDVTKYYSAEELANYNEAKKKYRDSINNASWPNKGSYPTYNPEKHKDAYFNKDTEDGQKRYNEWADVYNKYVADGQAYNDSLKLFRQNYSAYIQQPVFYIKEIGASRDGNRLVTSVNDINNGRQSVMIDVDKDDRTILSDENIDGYFPTSVFNDGTVFLSEPAYAPPLNRNTFVYKDGKTMDFAEWIKTKSERAYNDLTNKFVTENGLTYLGAVVSKSADGTTFGGFNQDENYAYTGWIMNLKEYDDYIAGVNTVTDATNKDVLKEISYTDLIGRRITNPVRGLYIKTVKLSDGTVRNTKIIRP